jgi:hypothetical protein
MGVLAGGGVCSQGRCPSAVPLYDIASSRVHCRGNLASIGVVVLQVVRV